MTEKIRLRIITVISLVAVLAFILTAYAGSVTTPDAPIISSSTHPSNNTWYSNDDVSLYWSTTYSSNIKGYSYVLDRNPNTNPDHVSEGLATTKDYYNLAGSTWYFHVIAITKSKSWSKTGHFQLNIDPTAPTLPSALIAITVGSQVNLSWDTASDSDSGIKEYIIERSSDDFNFQIIGNTSQTSFSDSPGVGEILYYRVKAVDNASNSSVYSNVASASLIVDSIAPTTALSLSGNLGSNNWFTSNTQAVLNADDDGGSGLKETRYRLNSGDWTTYSLPIVVSSEGFNTLEYYSIDNSGNAEPVKTENIKIDTQAPTSPTNLTRALSGNQVSLLWDTSIDITSDLREYVIERSIDGSTFVNIETTNQNSFTDQNLNTGIYYYKIKAVDNASNESDYSNVVSIEIQGSSNYYTFFDSFTTPAPSWLNDTAVTTANWDTSIGQIKLPLSPAWTTLSSGTTNNLRSSDFIDSNIGWAVGDNKILKTIDGGNSWITLAGPTWFSFLGVDFADTDNGWAVGANASIYRTGDGGVSWTAQNSGLNPSLGQRLWDVQFIDSNTGWVVGDDGIILKTTDGGTSWTQQNSGTTWGLWDVYFVNSTTGWAVGDRGTILKTTDAGATWLPQSSGTDNYLLGVHFTTATTGWAVGGSGTILKTLNGGNIWVAQNSGSNNDLYDVYFTDSNNGRAVGNSGTVLKTTNGINWTSENLGVTNNLLSTKFVNANTGWIVGNAGIIKKLSLQEVKLPITSTWSSQTSNTTNSLRATSFVDSNIGWAVGLNSTILKTTNAGESWTAQNPGSGYDFLGIDFIDANTGWAVGYNATILKTTDGGINWLAQNSGLNPSLGQRLWDVQFIDSNTGWVVGDDGIILKTTDGGTSWTQQNSGTTWGLWDVYFVNSTTGWAVGDRGTILKTTDAGATWLPQSSGTDNYLLGVHFTTATTGWAVGGYTILKTTDGGASWSIQNFLPDKILYDVDFTDVNTGWAVGLNGVILKTTNGGTNWTAEGSETTNNLFGLDLIDDKTGWVVGTAGIIKKLAVKYPFAQSLAVDNVSGEITKATLTATETLNGNTIDYQLSRDGGLSWENVSNGVEHIFTSTSADKSSLKWRAFLSGNSNPGPILEDITINYYTG